ncbi:MAG: sensor domain-containing diguanylate cyclase [Ketobacter sp.]|nr:MAG: sensor domain-containing diguanylate cyclase [Ketobacter sp.]
MFNRDEWILEQQNPMISKKKWQTTVDLIAKLYEAPAAYIIQHTSSGLQIVISSSSPINPYPAGKEFAHSESLFSQAVVNSCEQLYVNHATNSKLWKQNPVVQDHNVNSYLGVPIYWPDGSCFGAICVVDFAVTHYNKAFQELIWQFRDIVEADLMLNNQFLQLLELSTKDELSRLLNRRGFFIQAEKHIRLAQRLNQNVGVLYMDLDNLKAINDQHGHRIGDKAICALSTAVRNVLRESDVAGRIGGDEFVVVMLAQDQQALIKLTERIRTELSSLCVGELENIELSASIGSRLYGATELINIDKMVSEVDEIMYREKNLHHAAQSDAG